MNKTNLNPISIICLHECWTDETSAISLYNLNNYTMIHQGQRCCGHGVLVIHTNTDTDTE